MSDTHTFKFALFECVQMARLQVPAAVISRMNNWRMDEYQVVYWAGDNRKVEWVMADELLPLKTPEQSFIHQTFVIAAEKKGPGGSDAPPGPV